MGKNIIWSIAAFCVLWFLIVKLVWAVRADDEKAKAKLRKLSPTGIVALYGAFGAACAALNSYLAGCIGGERPIRLILGVFLAVGLPVLLVKLMGRFLRGVASYYNGLMQTEVLALKGGDEYTAFLLVLLCEGVAGLFLSTDTNLEGYRILAASAAGAILISGVPVRWMLRGTAGERELFKGTRLLREALKNERSGNVLRTLVLSEFLVMYLVLSSRTRAFYALALGAGCGAYVFLIIYYFKGTDFIPERRLPEESSQEKKEEAAEMKKTFAGLKEAFQNKTMHIKASHEEKKEERREEKEESMEKREQSGVLYFARHGESTLGAKNMICGATDAPLTEKGRAQAEKLAAEILAEGIKIDCILSSPLKRALETAQIAGEKLKVPVKTDARLREQNFGIWEETDRSQAAFLEIKKNPAESFKGGENLLKVSQRVYAVLDELKDSEVRYLLISHNGVARVMASYFETLDGEAFYNYTIGNASLKKFDYRRIGQAPIEKASDVVVRDAFDEIEKLASFVEEKGEK